MRKLLITLLIYFLSFCVFAQNYASIIVPTSYAGIGIRYDRTFGYPGFYTSASYGHRQFNRCSALDNVLKYAVGFEVFLPSRLENFSFAYPSFGINYNQYWTDNKVIADPCNYSTVPFKFKPISLEAGCGFVIGKFTSDILMDIFKNQFQVSFGLKF